MDLDQAARDPGPGRGPRRCSTAAGPEYQRLAGRRGIPPEPAARRCRDTRPSVAAAMLLHDGQADAAICGGTGAWWRQIQYILPIIPRRPDVNRVYALSCLIMPSGVLFICDTHMVMDPTAEQIAEMTLLAAEAVRGFRPDAQGGAGVALQLSAASDSRLGAQDAPGPGDDPRARAGTGSGRRDAWRCGSGARRSATRQCPTAG